jgi:hypothetical protein
MFGISLLFVCAEAAPKAEATSRVAMISLRMAVNLLKNVSGSSGFLRVFIGPGRVT